MEGFNVVDGVVLAIVILSSLLAYARGLVREVMAILGWIAAALVARRRGCKSTLNPAAFRGVLLLRT